MFDNVWNEEISLQKQKKADISAFKYFRIRYDSIKNWHVNKFSAPEIRKPVHKIISGKIWWSFVLISGRDNI